MLTKNINLKSFKSNFETLSTQKNLKNLLRDQPKFFESLKPTYKYSYSKKKLSKFKKISNIRIIGMGGSVLGSEAIYNFLKKKNQKKDNFCK